MLTKESNTTKYKINFAKIRAVITDVLAALASATILALILSSLSASGIITMGAAIFLLSAAFAVGTFSILASSIRATWKAAIIGLLGCCLFTLGWYEDKNFVPPLTKQEVAQVIEDGTKEHPVRDISQCPPDTTQYFEGNSATGFKGAMFRFAQMPDHACFINNKVSNGGGVVDAGPAFKAP